MHAVQKLNHLNNSETTTLYSEYSLGLGQTSNFSWDEPNLVSYKCMNGSTSGSVGYVRLNEIQSSNTFYPSASDWKNVWRSSPRDTWDELFREKIYYRSDPVDWFDAL